VLLAAARRISFPQPQHHGMQAAQAGAVQNQARASHRLFRTRHTGRRDRHQARQPVRQFHLQMRHPVHVQQRIGPELTSVQRMRHCRDHNLARQQGAETS
jgi:hypothetical protein